MRAHLSPGTENRSPLGSNVLVTVEPTEKKSIDVLAERIRPAARA
jgi:hypothetical protein